MGVQRQCDHLVGSNWSDFDMIEIWFEKVPIQRFKRIYFIILFNKHGLNAMYLIVVKGYSPCLMGRLTGCLMSVKEVISTGCLGAHRQNQPDFGDLKYH